MDEQRVWGFYLAIVIVTSLICAIVLQLYFSWPVSFSLDLLGLQIGLAGVVFSLLPPIKNDKLIRNGMLGQMTAGIFACAGLLVDKKFPRLCRLLFFLMLAVQFFFVFPLLPKLWRRLVSSRGTEEVSPRV